jgi:hypothetical protein
MVVAITVGVLGFTLLPASSAGGKTESFRLCDQNKPGFSHDIDVGEDGFSPGDYNVFVDKLLDPKTGRKAGRDYGKFTVIRPIGNNDAAIMVDAMFFLPNGKISVYVAGKFSDFGEGTSYPVTGGTGHFENVTGSVFLKSHPCDGKGGIVFDFNLQR